MKRPRRLKSPPDHSAITAAVLADRRLRRGESARERRPTRAAKGAGGPWSAAVADTRSLLDEGAELETAHEPGTAMGETLERLRTRTELIERQNRLILALLRARRLRELLEVPRTAIPDPTSE